MAAVPYAGIDGDFSFAGFNARIAEWEADLVQDVNDASGFSTTPWRENLAGMKVLRGRASGYLVGDDTGSAPLPAETGDAAAFTLTASTGCTLDGSAILSNARFGTGINGNATVTFEFVSTGAVTITWDETAPA